MSGSGGGIPGPESQLGDTGCGSPSLQVQQQTVTVGMEAVVMNLIAQAAVVLRNLVKFLENTLWALPHCLDLLS